MADSDVRIVDSEGNPSYRGRVEFRLDGRWGSVCAQGVSQSAAR